MFSLHKSKFIKIKYLVFATNSDFIIPLSFQPNAVVNAVSIQVQLVSYQCQQGNKLLSDQCQTNGPQWTKPVGSIK